MGQMDLANLRVHELLDLAIHAEEEAAQRYGEYADQMETSRNLPAAGLFRQIQSREIGHLGRLREQRARWSAPPTQLQAPSFFDRVEAPSYEGASPEITPTHVYEVALQGEERACAFYQKLTDVIVDSEARELARALWTEELGHVEWVARELRALPPTSRHG